MDKHEQHGRFPATCLTSGPPSYHPVPGTGTGTVTGNVPTPTHSEYKVHDWHLEN